MNVVFLCSHGFDYVQDLSFSGLNKNLPNLKVTDYPWNKKYHLPLWRYPKNMGYSHSLVFKLPGSKALIKTADIVIVGAVKADVFRVLLSCITEIPRTTPLVLLDGGDVELIGGDLHREGQFSLFEQCQAIRPFDLIFKREMLEDKLYPRNVNPYPLSFNPLYWSGPTPRKRYQVAFWGVESHPIRSKALALLDGQFDCRENGTRPDQSFNRYKRRGGSYFKALAQCEVVLSFWGAGYEALRFWETLGVGSFLLSQRPKIRIDKPFIDNQHVVYLDDNIDDLLDKCRYYLKHKAKREAIARAGRAHLLQHHTVSKRIEFLLTKIGEFKDKQARVRVAGSVPVRAPDSAKKRV